MMRIHVWRVVVLVALVAGSALARADVVRADGRATCFLAGEVVDGLNKICYYDCPGGKAAITVKSYQLCPLRIQR